MARRPQDVDPADLAKLVFQDIDKDNSGTITASELLNALNNMGEDLECVAAAIP